MEHADQTLHDFVLNLLSDTQALSAFEQDPAAMLDHAGLSDISAADVQEVIPLVTDFVPAHADALDSIMSQLPLDSIDTGQLGAIQQLQFVTQALGGIPAFNAAGSFDSSDVQSTWQLGSDGSEMSGGAMVNTPVGAGGGTFGGDLQHGMTGSVWSSSMAGEMHASMALPGLDSLPSLGGLPSGFSALSDVTDALDGHVSSMADSANNAANMVAGVADLATGSLANPAELTQALSNPGAAPHALSTVQGVVGNVTGDVLGNLTSNLPTGALGDLGHVDTSPATHALSSVQGVVSDVTSHSPVADITSTTGVGNLLGTVDHATDV